MRYALTVALMIAGVLGLSIVGRLWRDGRISDRAAAAIIVGWAPALILIYGLIQRYDSAFIALGAGILGIVGVTLYRPVRDLVRDQARRDDASTMHRWTRATPLRPFRRSDRSSRHR